MSDRRQGFLAIRADNAGVQRYFRQSHFRRCGGGSLVLCLTRNIDPDRV